MCTNLNCKQTRSQRRHCCGYSLSKQRPKISKSLYMERHAQPHLQVSSNSQTKLDIKLIYSCSVFLTSYGWWIRQLWVCCSQFCVKYRDLIYCKCYLLNVLITHSPIKLSYTVVLLHWFTYFLSSRPIDHLKSRYSFSQPEFTLV